MIQKNKDSLSIWFFENLLRYKEICHFVSSRIGGFSGPPYESLNLSFHVDDDPQRVLENRKLLASVLGFSANDFVTSEQVHGGNVTVITEKNHNLDAPPYYKSIIKATDAMITNVSGICLMILLADCTPILFYDPKRQVIGIAHAGWSGTVNKIVENTVNTMCRQYNSTPKDIIAGIGPSIGPCCYEIKLDVIEKVRRNLDYNKVIISMNNKYYLDLWKANEIQLLNSGISKENIEISGICTKCNSNIFFSARANGSKTGRFGAGIMIRD